MYKIILPIPAPAEHIKSLQTANKVLPWAYKDLGFLFNNAINVQELFKYFEYF